MRQFTGSASMTRMACGLVAIAVGCWLGSGTALAAKPSGGSTSSLTGQSAMIFTEVPGKATVISNNVQWDFNSVEAYATYTNVYTSTNSTATCTGSPTNCALTNKPSAPAAPPADSGQFNKQFEDQIICTTYYGGTGMPTKPYTQTATTNGVNGGGNWTFTYNYLISSSVTGAVPAHLYWVSSTVTNGITFNVNGVVAASSWLSSSKTTKYSFTLVDSSTLTRVQGVTAILQKQNADQSWSDMTGRINYLGDLPIQSAAPSTSCALLSALFDCTTGDFIYVANAGTFGSYPTSGGSNSLVSAILLNDNWDKNNSDLANGNVHFAFFNTKFLDITDVGTYRVKVTGTLKGNSSVGTDTQITTTSATKIFGDPNCP